MNFLLCSSFGFRLGWVNAVEALEIIGFLLALTALFLILCLVLLDELTNNKAALITFIVFAIVGGMQDCQMCLTTVYLYRGGG